jgi:hypothetical protein
MVFFLIQHDWARGGVITFPRHLQDKTVSKRETLHRKTN